MMVRPRIRSSLSWDDLSAFATEVVQKAPHLGHEVRYYLDNGSPDELFQSDRVRTTALSRPTGYVSQLSLPLYLLVAVTDALVSVGIEDLDFADYVASLLLDFATPPRSSHPLGPEYRSVDTVADMLKMASEVDAEHRDQLYILIAEFTLWLSGFWCSRVRWRNERRGSPGLAYYEFMGKSLYQRLSESTDAISLGMAPIYRRAATQFTPVRVALNDVADRCITATSADNPIERMLLRSAEIVNART